MVSGIVNDNMRMGLMKNRLLFVDPMNMVSLLRNEGIGNKYYNQKDKKAGVMPVIRTAYRRFSFLSDMRGIRNAIGEMRGFGFPPQPLLNKKTQGLHGSLFSEERLERTIAEKVISHGENCFEYPFHGERIFDEPLVGFVPGSDIIFEEYKTIIGPHHFTPHEIMAWQAKRNGVEAPAADDIAVVALVLPVSAATRKDNRDMTQWPAERWAQTRLLGEIFSQALVRELVTFFMDHGVLAVSPDVTPMFNKKRYPGVGWASPWSHRHMAYAAGLGTFGMQDFLITERGVAHRLASFVVNLKLAPNRMRPRDIHAWCLHRQGIPCLKCARRCPVGAIDEGGHDKESCYKKVAGTLRYCNSRYHIFIYGCGLCATGVPCESGIPKQLRPR